MSSRKTIRSQALVEGIGLHSGAMCRVHLQPAPAGTGIQLNGTPLTIHAVESSTLATTIETQRGRVQTVEHLLAAVYAHQVDDLELTVDGGEVPVLDGSAGAWISHLSPVNSYPLAARAPLVIDQVIEIRDGASLIRVEPAPYLTIAVEVDFPLLGAFNFVSDVANWEQAAFARTFGFLEQHEALKRRGLARGATLDNTLVFDNAGIPLNQNGLRYPDEIARHKWIDCLGDLALLGQQLCAKVTAVRAGHRLHHALVRRLVDLTDDVDLAIARDARTLE